MSMGKTVEKEAGLQFLPSEEYGVTTVLFAFSPHHLNFSFFLNEVVIGPGLQIQMLEMGDS